MPVFQPWVPHTRRTIENFDAIEKINRLARLTAAIDNRTAVIANQRLVA